MANLGAIGVDRGLGRQRGPLRTNYYTLGIGGAATHASGFGLALSLMANPYLAVVGGTVSLY